jgi:hypothetical protein
MPSEPVKHVLSRLEKVTRSGSGWSARCPAHDDSVCSLSIGEGHDGKALIYCHAGCTFSEIVAALRIQVKSLFPGPRRAR